MAIYEFNENGMTSLQSTTFSDQKISERQVQNLLKDDIEIISPETMVIAEEFGSWDTGHRRIDLLCLDKEANLVVVELKRTEEGGHMELQAIRYSAMVSTMTFDQAVEAHADFLRKTGPGENEEGHDDARQRILDFLDWDEPNEDAFAQDVRIVLASADFSKELTGAVLWLNDKGIDIRCVRMEPFYDGQKLFLDIQQVIPLPEAEQFQVQVRQKKQKERQSIISSHEYSSFSLSIAGQGYSGLNKRKLMYQLVSDMINNGIKPREIADIVHWMTNRLFIDFEGELDGEEFENQIDILDERKGNSSTKRRYFIKEDELFTVDGRTYALSNQWGQKTVKAVDLLKEKFPDLNISFNIEQS